MESFTLYRTPVSRHLLLAVTALVGFIVALIGNNQFRKFVFSESTSGRLVFESDIDNNPPELHRNFHFTGSPLLGPYGISVAPGQQFAMEFSGQVDLEEIPYIRIWSHNGSLTDTRVSFSLGERSQTFTLPGNQSAQPVIPTLAASDRPEDYKIVLSAALPASASQPALVIDRLEVAQKKHHQGVFDQRAWGLFSLLLVPFIVYFFFTSRDTSTGRALIIAVITTAVVALLVTGFPAAASFLGAGLTVLALVLGWLLSRRHDDKTLPLAAEWIFLAGFLSIAGYIRWRWMGVLLGSELVPDAVHYFRLVSNMTWPYDTEAREPFLMWAIWAVRKLTAPSEFSQRLTTVFASFILGTALYWLARRFMPTFVAGFVVLLYAINPALGSNAVLGLREECLPLGWVLFLLGIVRYAQKETRFVWLLIGTGAVIAILTRLNAAAMMVPVFLIAWYMYKLSWRSVLLVGAMSSLLILPHLIRHAVVYGDPFRSMNLYKVSKKDELPTPMADHERPPNVLSRLAGQESNSAIASRMVSGTFNMLFGWTLQNSLLRTHWTPQTNEFKIPASLSAISPNLKTAPRLWERILFLFYLIGVVAIFRKKGGWALPASMFLFAFPISYILELAEIREPRMLMNHLPIVLCLTGYGVYFCLQVLMKFKPETEATRAYGNSDKLMSVTENTKKSKVRSRSKPAQVSR